MDQPVANKTTEKQKKTLILKVKTYFGIFLNDGQPSDQLRVKNGGCLF